VDDEELDKLFAMDGDEGAEDDPAEPDTDSPEDGAAGEDGVFVISEAASEETADTEPEDRRPLKRAVASRRRKREWFEESSPETESRDDSYDNEEEEYDEDDEPDISNGPGFFTRHPISVKAVLLVLLLIALVTGIVLVLTLDSFRIRTINVEGNFVFSDEELIALSEITPGSHLFFANYSKAARAIKDSSPYIRECKVSFTFPSTVNINIEERSKIAYVKTPDGYAALDDQGIVLELSSFDSKHKIAPVISGLNITHATLGKEIVIGNYSDYQKSLIVLGSLIAADTNDQNNSYSIFENTEEVRVLPSGYIFLTIRLPNKNLLQVKFDSLEKISTQTSWLLYAIESKVFEHGFASGSLDMTRDEPIYRQFVVNTDTDTDTDSDMDAGAGSDSGSNSGEDGGADNGENGN